MVFVYCVLWCCQVHAKHVAEAVSALVIRALEESDKYRGAVGSALDGWIASAALSPEDTSVAVDTVLEGLEDLLADIPHAVANLCSVLLPSMKSGALQPDVVRRGVDRHRNPTTSSVWTRLKAATATSGHAWKRK